MKNFSGNWVWFCDIENMYNHIYSVGIWISHHVPQVVHAQLVRVDPQLILLVVGLNQLHVLLPDGPADVLLTLQQTRDRETVWEQWQWRLLVSVTICVFANLNLPNQSTLSGGLISSPPMLYPELGCMWRVPKQTQTPTAPIHKGSFWVKLKRLYAVPLKCSLACTTI